MLLFPAVIVLLLMRDNVRGVSPELGGPRVRRKSGDTESKLLKLQSKDSSLLSFLAGQRSARHLPGAVEALHASFCWLHSPAGLGPIPHQEKL